ncbi:hypothetical protein CEXT_631351 [Caerostris extrusa]|uniref:Uncharacterized protein n=1 Tax=Caerostris extrusa TaxID=172846 RepID=A0AAV4YC45_CAEEX|nr:hypothetical protein CEXT_631351 [Caerostris extrusa]
MSIPIARVGIKNKKCPHAFRWLRNSSFNPMTREASGSISTYNKPCLEARVLYAMGDVPMPRNWGASQGSLVLEKLGGYGGRIFGRNTPHPPLHPRGRRETTTDRY